MADLQFFSQWTRFPLEFDEESQCAVVEQFGDPWFVRVISDPPITPVLRIGDRLVALEWRESFGGFVRPADNRLQKDIGASAGLLRLYHQLGHAQARPLDPPLYLGPASLTEQEYAALLDRLGQLAFAHSSAVVAPLVVLTESPGVPRARSWQSALNDHLSSTAQAFLSLSRAVETNWKLIRKAPAKEVRLVPHVVDVSHTHRVPSARVTQKVSQRPDLRRQEIYLPTEHLDTSENRFLAFVLRDVLLRQAEPLAGRLRQRAGWLRSSQGRSVPYRRLRYQSLWRKRKVAAESEARRLEGLADVVEKTDKWAKAQRQKPFLRLAVSKGAVPARPSARLIQSKEYGPIYKAFQEYTRGHFRALPSSPKELTWALEERTIRPTHALFEIWAFVETYAMLVDIFGFEAVGQTPLALIDVVDGKPTLPEGSSFALRFVPQNTASPSESFDLELRYSPRLQVSQCRLGKSCFLPNVCPGLHCYSEVMQTRNWSSLTPDVLIELKARRKLYRFAIDAKYRRYEAQRYHPPQHRRKAPVDSMFEEDLLVTAKMKYLDGLGCDAAFILHSDPDSRFTAWGNESLTPTPHRERNGQPYWPGHRFGAIFASPKDLGNLERLLRCFLMYHAGLDDICWPCRAKLTEENGGKNKDKQPGLKGDYYQCPDCGRFWVSTVCQGKAHHRLIKMGRDSFHKTKPNQEWHCICPLCGDEFEPVETNQRKG